MSYYSNPQTSLWRLLSSNLQICPNHEWFTYIFIFFHFLWESNLDSSARFLGDTYLFLWAVQLWLRVSPGPSPAPWFWGKVLPASSQVLRGNLPEGLFWWLLLGLFSSQAAQPGCGSAGQICISNMWPICLHMYCVFIKNKREIRAEARLWDDSFPQAGHGLLMEPHTLSSLLWPRDKPLRAA